MNHYQKLVNVTNFFINTFPRHAAANGLECKRLDEGKSSKRGFHSRDTIYTLDTSAVISAGTLLSILIIAINEPLAIPFKRLSKTGCLPKIRRKSFMLN